MSVNIISQNLVRSGFDLPDAILRINLAWHKDLSSVEDMLKEYKEKTIMLDVPTKRKKPPKNMHNIDEVITLAKKYKVKYVAISNVEYPKDVDYDYNIIPKVETYKGVMNAHLLPHPILMLDHEDLYSDLVRIGKEKQYLNLVTKLSERKLLRMKGVIFSDY